MALLLSSAKKRITVIWIVGGLAIFFGSIVLAAMMDGGSDEKLRLGTWLLPLFMPTLSLIVGVLINDARGIKRQDVETDLFLYQLALGLSVTYLVALVLAVLIKPFISLDVSIYWVVALQGLTTAALGAFFAAPEKKV